MVTMQVKFSAPSGAQQKFFEDLVDEILMAMQLRNLVVQEVIVENPVYRRVPERVEG